jgi:tRNA-splicing ligase RtcB
MKASKGRSIRREMEDRGVFVMAAAKGTLAEEIPEAYKDIDEVVNVVHGAGLSRKVARLRAVGCVKG